MSPVRAEEFLMFVEKSAVQSPYDPLTILLPDAEDPECFQPLLFSDRPLTCDQWDNFYLPSSLFLRYMKFVAYTSNTRTGTVLIAVSAFSRCPHNC
jgi:hypothetical protein